MKKTVSLLILIGVMILSLTGCGALLNGNKQLTSDALKANGVTPTITLEKIYYLKCADIDNILIPFWNYDYFSYLYLLCLDKKSDTAYKYTKTNWDLSDQKSKGYGACLEDSLADAYMLASKYFSFDDEYEEISNVIKKDDIIVIDADDSSTWPNQYCYYSNSTYSGYTCYSGTMTGTSQTISSSKPYLWVKLNNSIWVCLGDVY